MNGRDSVRKVLETFQERGGEWAKIATQYYGPVIENFTCDKTIYTAVEVRINKLNLYLFNILNKRYCYNDEHIGAHTRHCKQQSFTVMVKFGYHPYMRKYIIGDSRQQIVPPHS